MYMIIAFYDPIVWICIKEIDFLVISLKNFHMNKFRPFFIDYI